MPTLPTRARARSSESGSVLLMVLVLMTILGRMAVSFAGSSDDRIRVVADGSAAMRAEFAAQSGVEYAMRRMQFAPRWTGTDPAGIALADGSVFHVEVLEDAFATGGDAVKLRVRGESPDSACQLGVDADVSTGWSADADVEGELFKYSTTDDGVSAAEHRVNAQVRASAAAAATAAASPTSG